MFYVVLENTVNVCFYAISATLRRSNLLEIYSKLTLRRPLRDSWRIARDYTGLITKISKLSERHEIFFHRVILIVDFESELRIDKNLAI